MKTFFFNKYLVLLNADYIMHGAMKSRMKGEYTLRVRKFLNSKLNCGNVFKGINNWAVEKWTKNELADLDHNSSKLLTMHGALRPKCINVCINQAEKEGVDCLVSTKLLALKKGILIYMSTRARSAS